MKSRKILSMLCAAAIIAGAMSATAYAESADTEETPTLIATNAAEESVNIEQGVYALSRDGSEVIDMYLCFTSDTTGYTVDADIGVGVGFDYERPNGTSILFHFGAADNDTTGTLESNSDGTITLTMPWGDETYQGFTMSKIDADPATFGDEMLELINAARVDIKQGVYALYKDGSNDVTMYLVFTSDESGIQINATSGVSIGFDYERPAVDSIEFHFGSVDSTTHGTLENEPDGTIALTMPWGDETYQGFTMRLTDDDPATFADKFTVTPDAAIVEDNDAQLISTNTAATNTGNAFTLSGADIKAECTSNSKPICYVTFKKLGSFELFFDFKLSNGNTKRYTVLSNRTSDYIAYVPMNDIFTALKIAAGDIESLTISGTSIADVAGISLNRAAATATSIKVEDANDENPHTGVELAIIPVVAAAGIAGGAFFLKKKKK